MPTRRELLIAGAALTLAGCDRAPTEEVQMLRAADIHVDGYPTVTAMRRMGDVLKRESNGRIGLSVYHAGQLGRESDTINLARFAALDIVRVNMAALNNPFPATRILSLPYVLDSVAHMRRALDGAAGREILRAFSARGLVGLAFYDSGARCFYNARHPVATPADLKGLKIRVPPSDIFMGMARALGANPTPLSYGEVFSALQTGLIDGAENNWPSFLSSRQFEVARYWSQTEHSYSPEALLMSQQRFLKLSPGDRDLVVAAAAESVAPMRAHWDRTEAEARDKVLAAGVEQIEVDRAAFRRAAQPLLASYLQQPELKRLYQRVRDEA
jgi:tripartite ATP-independent transporter DctP family solute receptor